MALENPLKNAGCHRKIIYKWSILIILPIFSGSSNHPVHLRIYVEEKMWQCKADILRLEFLWHHGGVYVDADMISVGKKSLNPIVERGKVGLEGLAGVGGNHS